MSLRDWAKEFVVEVERTNIHFAKNRANASDSMDDGSLN